ncbi:hypothetical protein LK07_23860 [Streptomyces pluripotens]|uniref:Lipoprotein n=1 Tax=Streptomyces pluripotens TaxID=1355015 RepID=A0A221P438_9ACTN|nr:MULTISPECIES: lipoprotein [Streptomyces]ARP72296.1 hypothetical protein LK06_022695 [Streptomyces pluripotens]ASN26545.1 hypothetical protein LK07_23860 [Streptomyces pluripotens]KIE27200.1 lipoprotein [Streptomyces sp. MUSC 125]MCH0556182.1 hypothetical protein [Streptomyces sp. MUM 16J]
MPARRPARTALAVAAVALLSATAAGCGDTGGLQAAGSTPTAISPAKLWPGLRPASSPAYSYDVATRASVQGVTVPGNDIRTVDPVDVVEAEIKTHPDDYGSKGAYHATVDRMKECRPGGDDALCPLLKPYYRDLTGDGRADLTLGFRLYPTNQTAVRVYTVERHKLVQVLADNDAIIGVELAGRALIERSPADISGYEYRTTWVWDPEQRAMAFSRDEYLHTGDGRHSKKSPAPAVPSPSATPTPPAFPSASER